jgi:hypothetical protein
MRSLEMFFFLSICLTSVGAQQDSTGKYPPPAQHPNTPTQANPTSNLPGMYVQSGTGFTKLPRVHPTKQVHVSLLLSGSGYWELAGSQSEVQLTQTRPHFVFYGDMDDDFVIVRLDQKSHRRELKNYSSSLLGAKVGYNAKLQTKTTAARRADGGTDLDPVGDLEPGEYVIMTQEDQKKVYDFGVATHSN